MDLGPSSEPWRVGRFGSAMSPRGSRRAVGFPGNDSQDDGMEKCLRIAPTLSTTASPPPGGSYCHLAQRSAKAPPFRSPRDHAPEDWLPFTWTVSPTRNRSTGTTSATLLVIPLIQALLNVWNEWCIPCQTIKQVQRSVEGEALGVPIDGTSGVIAPPRDQVADLTLLSVVLAGKCVTVFQIRRQASCVFPINVDLDAAAGNE